MNRNKTVIPRCGPSINVLPVTLLRGTQNYMLTTASNTGVDTKITDDKKKDTNWEEKN